MSAAKHPCIRWRPDAEIPRALTVSLFASLIAVRRGANGLRMTAFVDFSGLLGPCAVRKDSFRNLSRERLA